MRLRNAIIALTSFGLILLPSASFAADATLTLEAGTIGVGLGATRGEGTLSYKGHDIPFKYSGASLGEFGVTKVSMTGDVNNLTFLEKFNGCYRNNKVDGTIVSGTDKQMLKNDQGVELALTSKKQGLNLSISTGCAQMTLDPNALKKVLAALNEPPVKAEYHASVFFKTDSSKVTSAHDEKLNDVIAILKKNPGTDVIVSGFTDTTGSKNYNQSLSQERADSVLAALKEKAEGTSIVHLPPNRIEAIGLGQVKGPENMANQIDRRVDILIVPPARG